MIMRGSTVRTVISMLQTSRHLKRTRHPIQACVAPRDTDDHATCRQRKTRRSFSTVSSCDGSSIQCKTTQVSKVGLADEVGAGLVRETHLKAAA